MVKHFHPYYTLILVTGKQVLFCIEMFVKTENYNLYEISQLKFVKINNIYANILLLLYLFVLRLHAVPVVPFNGHVFSLKCLTHNNCLKDVSSPYRKMWMYTCYRKILATLNKQKEIPIVPSYFFLIGWAI